MARLMAKSERGSITIQVVIMSLLLFGALGLVIDSGRIYATHSQMQAYADQVALAAANELDGQPDSIERATKAAFGLNSGDNGLLRSKTSGGADIWVSKLVFWSDLRENFGRQDDLSASRASTGFTYVEQDDGSYTRTSDSDGSLEIFATSGVDSTASEETQMSAKYVSVGIAQHTQLNLGDAFNGIRNALKPDGEKTEAGTRISANATAGLERTSCDRLSTLVFCNPWEESNIEITDLSDDDLVGRSLMFFAPNFDGSPQRGPVSNGRGHGSHFRWSEPNQLYTLSDPIRDDVGVCSLEYLDPYFTLAGEDASSESSLDYMEVRDRCLLARAQVEQICYDDNTIGIRPAHGPTVLSAINVAFDIYNEPMDRVIVAADVVAGASTNALDLSLASFFEPDAVVSHPFERMFDANDEDLFPASDPDGIPDTGIDGVIDQKDYLARLDFGRTTPLNVTYPDTQEAGSPAENDTNSIISYNYGAHPAPNMRVVENGIFGWGAHDCHLATETQQANLNAGQLPGDAGVADACAIDFVGDKNQNPFSFTFGTPEFFGAVSEYNTFADQIRKFYNLTQGDVIPVGVERPWYDFYVFERSIISPLDGQPSGGGIFGNGPSSILSNSDHNDLTASATDGIPDLNTANDGNKLKNTSLDPGGEHNYDFFGLSNGEVHPMESFNARTGRTTLTAGFDFERRRIKAAFVNCVAATFDDQSDPDDGPDADGIYDAEIVEVLDVFLARPAEQYCGEDPTPRNVDNSSATPDEVISIMTCPIQQQVETRLVIETIGRAQAQPLDLFTAQLVR